MKQGFSESLAVFVLYLKKKILAKITDKPEECSSDIFVL